MHDKKRQSDKGSSGSEHADADRTVDVNNIKLESCSSGNAQVQEPSGSGVPPGYSRQGYCSCCQVHYANLEKHLAGDQHKHISNIHRNRTSTSMLMERFLQDVHLYHPQNYHDIRPTYDDIPDVNMLPSSHEDSSCTTSHALPTTVSCRTTHLSASHDSKTIKHLFKINPETSQGSKKMDHQQSVFTSTCQEALSKTVNTIPHMPNLSTLPLYFTSHATANNACFEPPHSTLCSVSNKNIESKYGVCKPSLGTYTGSPKKTLQNNRSNLQGSSCPLTTGKTSKYTWICKSQEDIKYSNHVLPRDSNKIKEECIGPPHKKNKNKDFSKGGNSVDDTIDAVIRKYCHKDSPERTAEEDAESMFSINVPSVTGCSKNSGLSFEWTMPLELKGDPSKSMMTNVDLHKEQNVNINEEYASKLKVALSASPTKEIEVKVKHEDNQEVLPALPHIPASFVGKTWSQVMYEDDLKVEAIVKEFRKGKFHCYFEEECSVNKGTKRKHKNKHIENNVKAKTEHLEEEKVNMLPLFEDDFCEDHQLNSYSIKSEQMEKPKVPKPCRRAWRQASRCQVVKVSHGTQTSLVNYPVVKRKILRGESQQTISDNFWEEKTPEMKTRMCALKLPESYTKILTPVQPKTMVYVLSHPAFKLGPGRMSRNRCSTDSRDSIYFKYKQSPLKYYDPSTNRILKTPPRNSLRGKSSKALCVRKLFRSLSSEGNVDKIDSEQKESITSKKSLSSSSNASLNIESVKGKDLTSSKKGSRSSLTSEYSSYEKRRQIEKPYTQISISPLKAATNKDKEDAQHNILNTGSKSIPLRPQKMSIQGSPYKLVGARISTRSKAPSQRIAKNLEKETKVTSGSRKQPKRKSSSILPKSNKPFVQTYQSSKKKVIRQNDKGSGVGHKKREVKSIKSSKTKQNSTNNHLKNVHQDKYTTRSSSKRSQNTKHYLRSRHKVTNAYSATRTLTNSLTRRNVR